jgi:hemolysin D
MKTALINTGTELGKWFERATPQTTAMDFAPNIIALQEKPPSPLPRTVLNVLLVLLAILFIWALIGKLDIVAVADGKLVPQSYLKIVQPADSGVVKDILVKEGEHVKAGQVLMRLDTTLAAADRTIVDSEVKLRQLQLDRIDSELSGRVMRSNGGDINLFNQVDAQATARKRTYQDALQSERAVLQQALSDKAAAIEQVAKLDKLLPTYQDEEQAMAKLLEGGHVSRIQFAQKQRERIQTEQDLYSQQRTVQSIDSRIAEAESRIARITSEYRQQLMTERVDTQNAFDKAKQELAKQVHRTELNELRAPQDGIVKDVATYTVGAVVNVGTVLVTLVPESDNLLAEVFVKNEDVGFVGIGQSVKLKLAAYPFQRYGMLTGKVIQLAPDASEENQQTKAPEAGDTSSSNFAHYKATVQLDSQRLQQYTSPLALAAGMRVSAEIKQGERTVMEYLLSPVQKTVNEAGRER